MIFLNENYVPCNLSRSVTLKRPGFNSANELKNYVKLKFKKKTVRHTNLTILLAVFTEPLFLLGNKLAEPINSEVRNPYVT